MLKDTSSVVLLVEDNPGDVRLMAEALREAKVATKTHVARDGIEAMAFLRKEGSFLRVPRPDLIILDLNLPRKDGREVLTEVKGDPELKHIPVIIFTSSAAANDILGAYRSHANCYLTKPVGFDEFVRTVRAIEEFWLTTAKLPQSIA